MLTATTPSKVYTNNKKVQHHLVLDFLRIYDILNGYFWKNTD